MLFRAALVALFLFDLSLKITVTALIRKISASWSMSPHQNKIRRYIQDYGWHHIGICSIEDCHPVSYTVGLTEREMPELIVVGSLSNRAIYRILLNVINRWEKDGVKLGRHSGIIPGTERGTYWEVELVEVDHLQVRDEFVVQLVDHYKDSPCLPRLVQIRWPDEEGSLPMGHLTELLPAELILGMKVKRLGSTEPHYIVNLEFDEIHTELMVTASETPVKSPGTEWRVPAEDISPWEASSPGPNSMEAFREELAKDLSEYEQRERP